MPLIPFVAMLLVLAEPAPESNNSATPALKVNIDTTEVPELEGWAEGAKALVEKWHPKAAELLASEGYKPPNEVTLVFKKDMKGVAHASGRTITIAANWVIHHPDDKGMVVHELVHVIQSYPPSRAGWLVEGLADWVRFYQFEPETRLGRPDPNRASYRDGYRTTAMFLDWVRATYDADLIVKLNAALRVGKYRPELFQEATGKSLDDLWAEFIKQAKERGGARR
jgi:Peptidase of plants and bacteria